MVFFLLHLFRLVVALKAWTIATIVFALEQETALQRSGGKCAQNQQWKKTAE